ncbi:MAG: hypothetical protein IJ297_04040 [Clostridia bacterium]|nr:hypothetical protein [Clostridia bacterium]
MRPIEFYNQIYSVLGSHTPLKGDCGKACNKACCEGDKDGDGMYLFPFEEEMYASLPDWASISETDFEYDKGKYAPLFSCDGVCDRTLRPLSCRIFPLTPYIATDGVLEVIVDPRANGMCPLAGLYVEDFDPDFVKAVEEVGKLLCENTDTKKFLESFSRMLDEINFL